jgi:hypothetical protein
MAGLFEKLGATAAAAATKLGIGKPSTTPAPPQTPEEKAQSAPMGSGYVKQTADIIKKRQQAINEIQ